MTPKAIARRATEGMDVIALLGLFATSELLSFTWILVPALLGVAIFVRRPFATSLNSIRAGRRLPLFMSLGTIGLGLFLWLNLHFSLIVAVASSAPILHASLWLLTEDSKIARVSQLRLAIGFAELLIAAILTSEVYLILSIFLFTLFAAIALSCNFLDKAFQDNQIQIQELNSRYIAYITSIAFMVLLSAAVIFPFLPRSQVNTGADSPFHETGYTENVTLDPRSRLIGGHGGRIAVKISASDRSRLANSEIATLIPHGLLRMHALNSFDGATWSIGPFDTTAAGTKAAVIDPHLLKWLKIEREALPSDALLAPYGTNQVETIETSRLLRQSPSGEWLKSSARNEKLNYLISLQPTSPETNYGSGRNDLYRKIHTEVPSNLNTPALRELAHTIFGTNFERVGLTTQKVNQLRSYFIDHKFDSTLEAVPQSSTSPVVTHFLLSSHTGNCEVFSSASAVLLRLAKIPTRLVTGFRITRATYRNVLTVRMGDAHAWLEYWVEGKGWRVFDPTPRKLASFTAWDGLQDLYDSLESVWYTYAYSFDAESQFNLGSKSIEKIHATGGWVFKANRLRSGIVFGIILILFFILVKVFDFDPLKTLLSRRNRAGPITLRILRLRMERLVNGDLYLAPDKFSPGLSRSAGEIFLSWRDLYFKARFNSGPKIDRDLIKRLREKEKALRHCLKTSSPKITG